MAHPTSSPSVLKLTSVTRQVQHSDWLRALYLKRPVAVKGK